MAAGPSAAPRLRRESEPALPAGEHCISAQIVKEGAEGGGYFSSLHSKLHKTPESKPKIPKAEPGKLTPGCVPVQERNPSKE